jgi:hypothetical protein
MNRAILLPVLSWNDLRGWPEHAAGGFVRYLPLVEAMRRRWRTDAHTAQYSVPTINRRLAGEAHLRVPVQMVVAIFDVDGAEHKASDEWWAGERAKVLDLFADVQGFCYRTRGGYRLVFILAEPFVVASAADSQEWSRRYRSWRRFLHRRYNIDADNMIDWARLFRLPRVRREGQDENRELIGNPKCIETWAPELTADDLTVEPEPEIARIVPQRPRRDRTASTEIQKAAERWLADRGAAPVDLDEAAGKWNADHPASYPKEIGQCPVCPAGHGKASFKRTPKDAQRWYCFSSNHPGTVGIKSTTRVGYHGDALDFDAYERGLSRVEVLRDDGYLDDALDQEARKRRCSRVVVLLKDGYLRRATETARETDFDKRLERVTAAMVRR